MSDNVEPMLTYSQAYRAMFAFLDNEYRLTKNDELAGLLSGLFWNTWADGKPADPGAWQDWLVAIERARNESKNSWNSSFD